MTIEEKLAYLSLCAEEAKSKDWGSGIKFAIEFIKDAIPNKVQSTESEVKE